MHSGISLLEFIFPSNDVDHFFIKIFPLDSPNPNYKNPIFFQILVFIIKTKQKEKQNKKTPLWAITWGLRWPDTSLIPTPPNCQITLLLSFSEDTGSYQGREKEKIKKPVSENLFKYGQDF